MLVILRSASSFVMLAILGSGLASAAERTAPLAAAPPADSILARAKEVFRRRPRPSFVAYTLSRFERVGALPDFMNSYEKRVWYRSSDGAALTRRFAAGRARGPLEFERPRFNGPLDPGPPTANIFDRAPPAAAPPDATPEPEDPPLRTIGSVSATVESDYHAKIVDADAHTYHLRLTPRRDVDRNRLRELWIDRETYAVRRFIATDRLYHGYTPSWDPELFDARLDREGDVPVIRTIHGGADLNIQPWSETRDETSDYRFYDISFPATLPDWYFEPEAYGAHVATAPEH
jgi:hypothetical protein